jgi:eukaryotic-like serine/threonine-protein kinase
MIESPPDADTLRKFALGDLPPAEWDRVAHYLEAHPQSPDTLAEPAAEDTFVSALRAAPADGHADSPELRSIIDAAAKLVPDVATAVFAQSVSIPFEPTAEYVALPKPGERLGRFRLARVLGRGGMGVVYAADDEQLDRQIALKVMAPQLAANPVAKERFLREARVAAKVEHDNIVPILEVGEDRGIPYMAMPLLRGRSLDERLNDGTPDLDETLAIARGTVDGLAAAHDRGLIHRDIKPSNLWLETNDDGSFRRVRLLDFGLARQETDADRVTKSGTILGTPAYMAPEQARGDTVDARADLFSLGCVLYRVATGQNAFKGTDTYSLLTSLALDRPKAPSELNADIPRPLSDLIVNLLEKDAKDRPASARAVRERLSAMTTNEPAPTRRRSRALPVAAIALSLIGLVGALFGGTIVRIATNKGELVVEVNDDNVEIVVKQNGAVVVDKTKDRRFVLTAKDGEIEFLDPETGVTTQTKTFRLTRGGVDRVVATMGVKPNPVAAKPGDPVRILAEWALGRGGVLGVRGTTGVTKRIADLPREPFDIWSLELGKATDADMADLGRYWRAMPVTKRRQLSISGIVTDEGLLQLAGSNVHLLSIVQFPVTERGLAVLGKIDGLQSVSISSANLAGRNLESIVRLPDLTDLSLNSNDLGDAGLRAIATMPKLNSLAMNNERITDDGLAALADHPSLGAITIYDDRRLLTDVACQHLARMKNLRTLTLVAYGLTDRGAKDLSAAKFNSLRLASSKFTDEALAHLAGMKSLTSLDLEFNKQFTPAAVQKLAAALPACRITWHGGTIEPKTASDAERTLAAWVFAKGGRVVLQTNDAMRHPKSAAELPAAPFIVSHVILDQIPGREMAEFAKHWRTLPKGFDRGLTLGQTVTTPDLLHLADLTITHLAFEKSPIRGGEGWAILPRIAGLRRIRLDGTLVPPAGVSSIAKCPSLVHVDLVDTDIGDNGLTVLAEVRSLHSLTCTDTRITAAGLSALAGRVRLRQLTLSGAFGATSPSLTVPVSRMSTLQTLNLASNEFTDADVKPLSALALTELRIHSTRLTAAALEPIGKLATLERLDLDGNKQFTVGQIQSLADRVPACRITWSGGVIEPKSTGDADRRAALRVIGLGGGSEVQLVGHGDKKFQTSNGLPDGPIAIQSIRAVHIDDDGVQSFRDLRQLGSLKLFDGIGDQGLRAIATFPFAAKLAHLELQNVQFAGLTDDGLATLAQFPALTDLVLNGQPRLTARGLARLRSSPKLERLTLVGMSLANEDLAGLQGLKIHYLRLSQPAKIGDAGLEHLAGLPELTTLQFIGAAAITDAGIATIVRVRPNLTNLSLNGASATDACLDSLLKLKGGLLSLDVQKTKVGAAAVETLAAAMPACRILWDGGVIEPKVMADADRTAALYALSIGGTIVIDGATERIADPVALPKAKFQLTAVHLGGNKKLDDRAIETFARCAKLEFLDFNQTDITDAGLRHLRSTKTLKGILLHATRVTDAGMEHLAGNLGLEVLDVHETQVTDKGLAQFQGCKSLHQVDLRSLKITNDGLRLLAVSKIGDLKLANTTISDDSLAHLTDTVNIRNLDLSSTKITDRGLKNLAKNKRLAAFLIAEIPITDDGLAQLDLKELVDFTAQGTALTDRSLTALAKLPILRYIDVRRTKVTGAGILAFRAAKPNCVIEWDGGLIEPKPKDADRAAALAVLAKGGKVRVNGEALDIADAKDLPTKAFQLTTANFINVPNLTDADFKVFDDCRHLRELDFRSTKPMPSWFGHFGQCANLEVLNLDYTGIGDAGLEHFKNCKKLRVLGLGDTNVTAKGLAHFAGCTELRELRLVGDLIDDAAVSHFTGCKNLEKLMLRYAAISNAGLERFASCTGLTHLDLFDCKIDDAALTKLSLKKLTEIVLSNTGIGDASLVQFEGNAALHSVDFDGTKITNAGLAKLKGMADRGILRLGGTAIGDAGLAHLAGKDFSFLNLSKSRVTDAGLAHLAAVKSLSGISIADTAITDAGLAHLKRSKAMQVIEINSCPGFTGTSLKELNLDELRNLRASRTGLTDDGLAHLAKCKKLESVECEGTKVTRAGIEKLQEAQPKCRIVWNGGTIEPK